MNITDINYDKNISLPLKNEMICRELASYDGINISRNDPHKTKIYQFGRLFNDTSDSAHLEVRLAPKTGKYEVAFDIEGIPEEIRGELIDDVTKRMSKISGLFHRPLRSKRIFRISTGIYSVKDKSVAVVLADIKQKMCDLEPCYKIACDAAKNYTK